MSTIVELQEKLQILESAYKHTVATGQVLMKELANGTVPCAKLREYNQLAASIFSAQFKIWSKLALQGVITGNLPAFPTMPVLFWEYATGRGFNFVCRAGIDLVDKTTFKAVRLDKPADLLWAFFGFAPQQTEVGKAAVAQSDGTLGIAPIILIIAGITVAAAATTVAYVAIEASKDKELDRNRLKTIETMAISQRFTTEARLEFYEKCLKAGGATAQCKLDSVAAVEKLKIDPNALGGDKFPSESKAAWLFGGGLGVLALIGGAWLYHNRKVRS